MNTLSRLLDPSLVEQLHALKLIAKSIVQGGAAGPHRSPVKGPSVEFRQHRIYAPGDEPRRVDWRILARTDRPYVKEYDEETNLRCLLILDASGSMAYSGQSLSKFEFASRFAAAVAYLLLSQSEQVGLAVSSSKVDPYIAPGASPQQLPRVIESLELSSPAGESSLPRDIHHCAERLEHRALVIILSDFFHPLDELNKSIAHLRFDGHEVFAVQIIDRDEETFPFHSWKRFVGYEGEPPRTFDSAIARKTYLKNFFAHRAGLQKSLADQGVWFQIAHCDRPLIDCIKRMLWRDASPQ